MFDPTRNRDEAHLVRALLPECAATVVQKGILGRRYVPVAPPLLQMGLWLFQCGAALGFGLREHPVILGKLLGGGRDDAAEYAARQEPWTSDLMSRASQEGEDFEQLCLAPGLAVLGMESVEVATTGRPRKIRDLNRVGVFGVALFEHGAVFGHHSPEALVRRWAEHPDLVRGHLDALKNAGVPVFPSESAGRLTYMTAFMLEAAALRAEDHPSVFDDQEIAALRSLLSQANAQRWSDEDDAALYQALELTQLRSILPRFDTWTGTGKVIERMTKVGWQWDVTPDDDGIFATFFDGGGGEALEPSVPVAVARAALNALSAKRDAT